MRVSAVYRPYGENEAPRGCREAVAVAAAHRLCCCRTDGPLIVLCISSSGFSCESRRIVSPESPSTATRASLHPRVLLRISRRATSPEPGGHRANPCPLRPSRPPGPNVLSCILRRSPAPWGIAVVPPSILRCGGIRVSKCWGWGPLGHEPR